MMNVMVFVVSNVPRPCLTCRALFVPQGKQRSYCQVHQPKDKRHRVHNKAYDDAEYRRNREIIKKQQRFCVWCGTPGTSSNKLQVDHIIPLSRSGTHKLENLRILCQNCHKLRQGKAHR